MGAPQCSALPITMMMMMAVVMLGPLQHSFAQGTFESTGTEFYLGFMAIVDFDDKQDVEVIISTTSEQEVNAQVTVPGLKPGFIRHVNVTRDRSAIVNVTNEVRGRGFKSSEVGNKAVHVLAEAPVSVFAVNKEQFNSDMYLAAPLASLGQDYIVVAYGESSQMMIVATDDNTTVTITLPDNEFLNVDVNDNVYRANDTFNITLHRYQTFYVFQPQEKADLTGCRVVSDKRVAVVGGNRNVEVARSVKSTGIDHVTEMLLPVHKWGTRFCLPHTPDRGTSGDIYRVVASQNNTEFVLGDGRVEQLNRPGDFVELDIPYDKFTSLTSDKPVAVAMFAKANQGDNEPPNLEGDSAMTLVIPEYLYGTSYAWGTSVEPFFNQPMVNSVSVIVEKKDMDGLVLDGEKNVTWKSVDAIEGCTKVQLHINVKHGSHFIYHQNPDVRFSALASGVLRAGTGQFSTYICPLGFSEGVPPVCQNCTRPRRCQIAGDPHLTTFNDKKTSLPLPCAYKATTLTLKNKKKIPSQTYYPEIKVEVVAGNNLHVSNGQYYVTDLQVKVTFKAAEVNGPSNTYSTGLSNILKDNPWIVSTNQSMQDRVVLSYQSTQQQATLRITDTSLRLQYYVKKRGRNDVPGLIVEVVDDDDLIYDGSIQFPSTMCSTMNDSSSLRHSIPYDHKGVYPILSQMEHNIPQGHQHPLCPIIMKQFSEDCNTDEAKSKALSSCFSFVQSHHSAECLGTDLLEAVSACMKRLCSKDNSVCAALEGFKDKCPGLGDIGDVNNCP